MISSFPMRAGAGIEPINYLMAHIVSGECVRAAAGLDEFARDQAEKAL